MDTSASSEYTDDEIRDELTKLGYTDLPPAMLDKLKKDLHVLIQHEHSKNSSIVSSGSDTLSNYSLSPPEVRSPLVETQHNERASTHNYLSGMHAAYGKENASYDKQFPEAKRRTAFEGPSSQNSSRASDVRFQAPVSASIDDSIVSDASSDRVMVRRKTLRRAEDGTKQIDESVTESDVGSLDSLEDRLNELRLEDPRDQYRYGGRCRPRSACSEPPPYRLANNNNIPASVILRQAPHPHTKNLQKCDPVNRYNQFKDEWTAKRAPGDKQRKQLRWNVREQMLYHDQVVEKKPQRVYVPNSYQVPTEKHRKALRWRVRTDIAHGHMPESGYSSN